MSLPNTSGVWVGSSQRTFGNLHRSSRRTLSRKLTLSNNNYTIEIFKLLY